MKFDRFYILLGSVLLATIFAGRSIADSTHASDEKKRNEPFQLSLATQNHGLQGYLSTFFDEGRMANITDMLAKPDLFSIND